MAETTSAVWFSSHFSGSFHFHKEPISSASTSFTPRRFFSRFQQRRSTTHKLTIKASGSSHFLGDEDFGIYPWENPDAAESSIQWVSEEKVTLFTSDGLIQIGGNLVPRRVSSADKKQGKAKVSQRSKRFKESNYMDPNQRLCLGAIFDIAATNGLDMGRRLCIFGFCRSIEMLCDVVEDTVLEHGGEDMLGEVFVISQPSEEVCVISPNLRVVAAEKAVKGGLHEKLTMTVAVPLLWGVPPASETLHLAVRTGGGIVDKVYWQWDFL